jgi:hypothetical protein
LQAFGESFVAAGAGAFSGQSAARQSYRRHLRERILLRRLVLSSQSPCHEHLSYK